MDGAAGGDRRRRLVGPAGRQVQADDRRHPVLGPARHHPAAAVEGVPFTAGDRRTVVDVVLYLALLISVAVPLLSPGVHSDSLSAACRTTLRAGRPGAARSRRSCCSSLMGLRDKTIFLAARGEQYLPALVFFAVLPFVDMIVALKLLIVVVWVGAGVSKFGKHFTNVVPPMVSNSPSMPFKAVKRAHYRDFPRRPAARRRSPTSWPTSAAPPSRSSPRWCCCSRPTAVADRAGRGRHGRLPPLHHLDVPARGAAGVEHPVRLRHASFLFLGFPAWRRLRVDRHVARRG